MGTSSVEGFQPLYRTGEAEVRHHRAGELPQSEKRECKATPVSEGKRGCDCESIEAFSDDMIYSMSVWFSGGHFFLAKYSHSAKSVVQ